MNKENEIHSSTSRIFLISDMHFDHENIIKYCRRPFKSKEEMNKSMINNWNSVVDESDTVYILGDVTFGRDHKPIDYWLNKLKGKKFLIKGNHDKDKITRADKIPNNTILEYGRMKFLLMHEPKRPENLHGWIIHGDKHNHDLINFPLVNCEKKTSNVCVELIDYKPILLDNLINKIEKCRE